MPQDLKSSTTKNTEHEPIRVSFSVPQIAGGALAAATAAAVGSQIGVAGTIVGAAVASLVGGVAGTIYSAGIDRTHRKVAKALQRSADADEAAADADQAAVAANQVAADAKIDVELAQAAETESSETESFETVARASGELRDSAEDLDPDARRRFWIRMGLTVAAIFLIAIVLITALELTLGRALDGKTGTTVGQLTKPEATATATTTTSSAVHPTQTTVTITQTATSVPTVAPVTATAPPTIAAVPTPSNPVVAVPTVAATG